MLSDRTIATIVAIAGVVTGLIGATVPVVVALINKRRAAAEGDDDVPAPQLGMPIPIDHTEDAYQLQLERLTEAREKIIALEAQNALLIQQQLTAYSGWRAAEDRLAAANRALEAAGLPTV